MGHKDYNCLKSAPPAYYISGQFNCDEYEVLICVVNTKSEAEHLVELIEVSGGFDKGTVKYEYVR